VPITVTVRGASKLGSLQLELRYDPQVLELQAVKAGPLAARALVEFNRDTPGRLRMGVVDASGISGDGTIIAIVVRPTGAGRSTALLVERVEATDTRLKDLVVSVSPGLFTAGSGSVSSTVTGPVLSFGK
jgi:hypothetical protein